MSVRLCITGANGHLGRRLIGAADPAIPITAIVRRDAAATRLRRQHGARPNLDVRCIDVTDAEAMRGAMADATHLVHLVGTIRQTRSNHLRDAHEGSATIAAAAAAAAGVQRIVYVSILGAAPDSRCECLQRRAAVEALLADAVADTIALRVPMVLGEGDRASGALRRRATSTTTTLFRGDSLEQPIYAGDVIAALLASFTLQPSGLQIFELAGPESLSRRDLVIRAARVLGTRPAIRSLPLTAGMLMAGAMELLLANPPLTRDMLKVLDHDDAIDAQPHAEALGISLTSLDEMLQRCMAQPAAASAQDATR